MNFKRIFNEQKKKDFDFNKLYSKKIIPIS